MLLSGEDLHDVGLILASGHSCDRRRGHFLIP